MLQFGSFSFDHSRRSISYLVGLAALSAVCIGIYARFVALGASSLAVDEHYLLASAQNVFAHGIPRFDCGGHYVRGLLHQYAAAGLLQAGVLPETAIRLPAAIADLATIAGVWLLATHVAGRKVATFVAVLMLLSVWQVEFARFGRMYAPLQAFTVFYALVAVNYLESGKRRYFRLLLALGVGALLAHEGGALLIALTLVIALLRHGELSLVEIALACASLLLASAMIFIDFRYLGAQPPYAAALAAELAVPGPGAKSLPIPQISLSITPIIAAIVIVAFLARRCFDQLIRSYPVSESDDSGAAHDSASTTSKRATERVAPWLSTVAWLTVALTLILGMFLLAAVMLTTALLLRVIDARRVFDWRSLKLLSLCTVLLAVVWVTYAVIAPEGSLVELGRRALLYPDFYHKVVRPWSTVLPYLGAGIALVSLAAGLIVLVSERKSVTESRYQWLLGLAVILLTAAVLSPQPYHETRYTYFLYPLLLILLAQGAVILWQRAASRWSVAAPLTLVAALFALSSDFNLRHLLHVDEPRYLYRLAYDEAMTSHLYPRWDYRGVADVINAQATPGDLVITTVYPSMPYYSTLFDAVYIDRTDPRLRIVSACEGARELWTNQPLLTDPAQLRARVEQAGRPVWLVVRTERYRWRQPVEAQLLSEYGANELYRSIDGNIVLLRIPATPLN